MQAQDTGFNYMLLRLTDSKCVYLIDGIPNVMVKDHPTIVFASPTEAWAGNFGKTGVRTFVYMPVWTREEIGEAIEVLHLDHLSIPVIDERFTGLEGSLNTAWVMKIDGPTKSFFR